jgi:hypothetical protein
MNPRRDLRPSHVEIGRGVGRARFQTRAAILAAFAAGIFVPAAPAQAPVTITVQMNMGGTVFSANATVPDPIAVVQEALQCGNASASCMQGVWDAATPVLNPPPSPPGPSQPEPTPGSSKPNDDSGKSPSKSASKSASPPTRADRERSRPPESARPASRLALAELAASPPLVQERASPPVPQGAALRGPDPLGPPAPAPSLPASLTPGFDWSPLLLSMLLASASFALLLFLLTAAPRHSLARVSYQLAERRYDFGLIGVAMFMGLAFGYFVAIWIG